MNFPGQWIPLIHVKCYLPSNITRREENVRYANHEQSNSQNKGHCVFPKIFWPVCKSGSVMKYVNNGYVV